MRGSLPHCVENRRWPISIRSNETSWETIAIAQRRDNGGSTSLAVEGVA